MKILFLSNNPKVSNPLYDWLVGIGEDVIYKTDAVNADYINNEDIEFIISYNYNSLIKRDIIDLLPHRIINLHISFLPYNRGADPNIWSFINGTPCGVTIHEIDDGLDTGDILLQEQVSFDIARETLRSSYEKLHLAIQKLFRDNWESIRQLKITPTPQYSENLPHRKNDAGFLLPILNYDDKISEFLAKVDLAASRKLGMSNEVRTLNVAFRIDIGSEIGMGHLVRMTALADVFSEFGHSFTIFKGEDEPIDYNGFDIVVLDSYLLSDDYIARLRSPNRLLVCYDDLSQYTYNCDVVLNANLYANELEFKFSENAPKMLLGGKYALLRKEFRAAKTVAINERANRVFVCFGGSDPRNMTPQAVKALQGIDDIELSVVLGGFTKHDDEVYSVAGDNTVIYKTPESMADIISSCDIAVASSGSMTYELAALGIPSITIAQADNQFLISEYMPRNGLMLSLGNWQDFDPDCLKKETTTLLGDYKRRKVESMRLSEAVDKNGAVNAAREILSVVTHQDANSLEAIGGCGSSPQ